MLLVQCVKFFLLKFKPFFFLCRESKKTWKTIKMKLKTLCLTYRI
jgi:hypothetical protein